MQQDKLKAAEAFIEKVVAPARAARKPDAKAVRARTELVHEDAEAARKALKASGIDPKALDKLAAERSKGRTKLAEKSHRRAVNASAAAARRLKDLAPVILPIDPVDTVIDQVTFIRSFAGQGAVIASNIGPSDNWAQYRVKSTSDAFDGTGRLSFFTLWQNQLSVPAVLMARANLIINARLSCDAEWSGVASWFGMSSVAHGKVGLRTTVWGMDSSVSSIVQQQDVAEVRVDGGFFGDDSSKSIEFTQLLPASAVVVPAQTYVLIEIEVLTDWSANGGASVTLDAESGSHRVDLPQLVLTVTPTEPLPPSISLSVSVSYATSPATVTLTWSGATTAMVDIYRNGVLFVTTANNGSRSTATNPGTYAFRVCEAGSTAVCSADVSVTVT
ncbi:MAG: hypothetical protein V4502_05865 [Pseudomonadota bacterium]